MFLGYIDSPKAETTSLLPSLFVLAVSAGPGD